MRIYVVQEYYKLKKEDGVTSKRIWENICKIFPISIDTFYSWLAVNVKKDLRDLEVNFVELNNYKENVIKSIQSLEKPVI